MDNFIFFSQLALLLIIAPIASKAFKIPIVVAEILLGSFAVWIGFIHIDNDLFKNIAKIGFFYLMFLAGLEIDLKRFLIHKDKLLKNAIIYFISIYSLSFAIYLIFNLNPVYVVAIPIISLGMIMALISEHGKEHKWLELVLIVGVIGEIISISAIVIYESYIHHGMGIDLYQNILIFFAVLLAIYYSFKLLNLIFWWNPGLKKLIMPENDEKLQSIRVSVGLFIVLIAIMHSLKIDMVLGAFFAGIYIANFFEHKKELPHILHNIGFGFLVPIFFIYVGTTFELESILKPEILRDAFFILSMIFIVRIASAFISFKSELSNKEVLLFGLANSMPLTFLIAIATIAYESSLMAKNEYLSFVLAGMSSGIIMMIAINLILYFSKK